MSNPYFKHRDKYLRKAEKNYRRAVEMQFMGHWLDHVTSMTEKMHKDAEGMHAEYKAIRNRMRDFETEMKQQLREISGHLKEQE